MNDTAPATLAREYMLVAYREAINKPKRRWWQRAKPPTGPQRERWMFEIAVEELGDHDQGRRISLTPFGQLVTISGVGWTFFEDGPYITIWTDDSDLYLPVGTNVYLEPPADTRGCEIRYPMPTIAKRREERDAAVAARLANRCATAVRLTAIGRVRSLRRASRSTTSTR